MGNFNPNYFDRKSGSLEEAIRMAVSGKINEEPIHPDEQEYMDDEIFPALKKARYNNVKKLIQNTKKDKDNDNAKQDVKDFTDLMKMASKIKKGPGNTHMDKELRAFNDKLRRMDSFPRDEFAMALEADVGQDAYDYLMMTYVDSFKAKGNKVVKEGFSPKEIKMAIGIAGDPRYKGGNMTGAVKAIEKIKDGLSDDPKVAAALKKMNEGSKEEYQKFFNATLKKFKIDSPADLKSDEEKKKFFNYIDKNYTGEKDEAYIASMRETKKWAGLSEMAYKPGSFKDTKAQEKGAKALDGLIKTGGLDKKDFQKARGLYVQAADAGSRNKLKNFIFNLDTEPKEAIMDVIGRNDPSTFLQMYPDAKEGEPLTTTAFKHRSMKSENYGIGTPENTKSKLNATPGQSVDDWKQQVEVMHKKQASMREALAKVWGVDEGHNPFDNKKEEKKAKKEDKTMTGKPMTKIKVDPDMKEVKLGKKNVR